MAQQTNNPTSPSKPATPHTAPIQNQTGCWDAATKSVRNPQTVGQNPGANPTAPQKQQSTQPSTADFVNKVAQSAGINVWPRAPQTVRVGAGGRSFRANAPRTTK
jgi:hypothetical protein